MDRNVGRVLDGRYKIVELVGIGGMADVYKAMDIMEDKVVAIKILKMEFATNEEILRRFRNESKAIAVLSHPNIVKVYDVGFTDQIQYIVMEYIDGINLKEYLEHQKILKWKEAIYFIVQILKAMQHAHDKGIVHRDIKPQNIMLFTDGVIKVMDFGIARFSRQGGKTLSEKTIGSVHYISPEQARGDLTDERSDIYSVGAMFYEMVTGRKVFDADTPVAVALKHMQDAVKKPTEYVKELPIGIEEIILKSMQKDPQKRYPSASAMIKDIEIVKRTPETKFGYYLKAVAPSENEKTQAFAPISDKKKAVKPRNTQLKPQSRHSLDDEIDDDYKKSENSTRSRSSMVVTMLLGVSVAFIIIAAIIVAFGIDQQFGRVEPDVRVMPNVVGMEFFEANNKYQYINFEATEEYSDAYPRGFIIEQEYGEDRAIKENQSVKVVVSKGPELITVPELSGEESLSAQAHLKNLGFLVSPTQKFDDVISKGNVIYTSPSAGERLAYGAEIIVYVSEGPISTDVKMPYVIGKTREEAIIILTSSKLKPEFKDVDSVEPAGTVLSQEFSEGKVLEINSTVIIGVSTGVMPEGATALKVKIPKSEIDYLGGFVFTTYSSGGINAKTINNVNDLTEVILEVEGEGIETINVEVTSLLTNESRLLGSYTINFDTGEFENNSFNVTALYEAENAG